MENKPLLILVSSLFGAVLLVALIFVIGIVQLSPKAVANSLEACKTLQFSSEEAIDVVFFAEEDVTKKYISYIKDLEPFNKYPDSFNFYYIDDYSPICERYQNIALFCYNEDLIKKSASCPHDYIVVIQPDESRIRSSAYLNVMSLNERTSLSVFAHEFGHVLGGLAEEYTPATLSSTSKNCVKRCSEFSGETDGCFEGCSRTNYFRSIDQGVMRTLSSNEYGTYNSAILEKQLRRQTSAGITGKVSAEISPACAEQHYYLLSLRYEGNRLMMLNKTIERGCAGEAGTGEESYSLIAEGKEIANVSFNARLIYTDGPSTDPSNSQIEGEVYTYEGPISLAVPIIPGAEKIIISSNQPNSPPTEVTLYDIDSRACLIS